MESGRKAWIVGVLACVFIIGASIWLRSASANRGTVAATHAQPEGPDFTLKVIQSNNDLHFTSASDLAEAASVDSGMSPVKLAKGDFLNNGAFDMVGLYSNGAGQADLRVRLAVPGGGFQEMNPIGLTMPSPRALAVADFNGDGNADIAVGGAGSISFYFGDGKGGFSAGPELVVKGDVTCLAVGDFDRDGRKDLVAAAGGSLYVYLNNNADLSKLVPNTIKIGDSSELVGVVAADFDNNHQADLAVATKNQVYVVYGAGAGNFDKPKAIGSASGITGIVAGDLTGHYVPDVAVSGQGGVTVFRTRLTRGFAAGRTYAAGGPLSAIERGFFNSDNFADLSVVRDNGSVGVLLNKEGKDFSEPKEIQVENGATTLLSGFRRNGVDSLAVGRHGGLAVTTAAAGATIVVTTLADEDDCPTCTSAQLAVFQNGTGIPGGHTGVSFREALTAANNDSLLATPIIDDEIVFTGLNSTPTTTTHIRQVQSTCILPVTDGGSGVATPGVDTYWLINISPFGTLPPIIASGLTIDGSQVDTTVNGVNNILGPRVVLSSVSVTQQGAFLLITSSAPFATIENLGLVGALGDAIQVAARNATITGNNIGLDCAGAVEGNGNGSGVNTGSGIDFLSGSVLETVTGNVIGNNGTVGFPGGFSGPDNEGTTVTTAITSSNGITINGISQSPGSPQGNVISGNVIGLDGHGRQAHNTGNGITLQNGAVGNTISNNTIDSSATSAENPPTDPTPMPLDGFGVDVEGSITADALIENNKIGTDQSGQTFKDPNGLTIGNEHSGVAIGVLSGNPKFNTVSGNVISGNGFVVAVINFGTPSDTALPPGSSQAVVPQAPGDFNGVGITMASGDNNKQFNTVASNLIGVNASGAVQIPNATGGVVMTGLANNNLIGGVTAANGNQISGNNGPGITLVGWLVNAGAPFDPNNNILENNEIGPNSSGAGGGPPLDQVTTTPQTSNKGGGILLYTGASETGTGPFFNTFLTNVVAFNSSSSADVINTANTNGGVTSAGLENDSAGNFNTFSENQIFLNPPNTSPTIPAINDRAGQENIRNPQILLPTSVGVIKSLINITSATTITSTGQTTITGTADYLDQTNPAAVVANINLSKVEVFVSQRGSTTNEALSEAQAFIGPVLLISSQVDPSNPTHNTVDWSASLSVPAPFLNPVQTPTLFLTATITTGDGSTSPLSYGFVPQFVTTGGGGGTEPTCSLTANPDPLNINGTAVGATVTSNITLTNASTAGTGGGTAPTVEITAMTLTQTGTQYSFQVESASSTTPTAFPPSGISLAPGATETVIVSYTPSSTTASSASLVISDTCGSLTVPINGSLNQPSLSVIPTSLSFGSVTVGQTSTLPLTLINFGPGSLTVTALTFGKGAGSPFSNTPATTLPLTVAAGSLTTVEVQFAPTAAGPVTDTLTIVSNDPTNPALGIALSGTGVSSLANPPTVTVSAPTSGQIVSSGGSFTVSFFVGDTAVPPTVNYTVSLSTNGGASFSALTSGVGLVGSNGVTVTAPNVTTQDAQIKVVVTDPKTSGPGTGLSGLFTIGTPPSIQSVTYSDTGKIKIVGTGIVNGAVLVVVNNGETFPLSFNGTKWVVKGDILGSPQGDEMKNIAPVGGTINVEVQNPGGLTSAPVSVTRS
jgi:hypothetical protein